MNYVDKPFPWTSKSKLLGLDYCPYDFYVNKVEKRVERKRVEAIEGTNLHVVFANFYKAIELKGNKEGYDFIFTDEFTDSRIPIERHPFRNFIYEACMQFVEPKHRNYDKYKMILTNFATIECRRWLRINTLIQDKQKIWNLFKPRHIEKRLEYDPLHLFGTIDRVNIEVMPDKTLKLAIYDYKTGKVPSSILKHDPTSSDMFDWELPRYAMKEMHFYGLLYLLSSGWQLDDRVKEFLENQDYWYAVKEGKTYKETVRLKAKFLTSLGDAYRMFKEGKRLVNGDILVGYYYLSGKGGYKPVKRYNYSSHKNVLKSINEYRSVVFNKHYAKHPILVFDRDVCNYKNCARYNECKELVEAYNDKPKNN